MNNITDVYTQSVVLVADCSAAKIIIIDIFKNNLLTYIPVGIYVRQVICYYIKCVLGSSKAR